MNLAPALQQEIERIATLQGISPEQFIVQTLTEKIVELQQQLSNSIDSSSPSTHLSPQLQDRDGILVIETAPLNHINFNALIDQLRAERDQEQMCL
jgi:hypothetical protein